MADYFDDGKFRREKNVMKEMLMKIKNLIEIDNIIK